MHARTPCEMMLWGSHCQWQSSGSQYCTLPTTRLLQLPFLVMYSSDMHEVKVSSVTRAAVNPLNCLIIRQDSPFNLSQILYLILTESAPVPHPKMLPQDLHIRSTTFIFSSRSSDGSSISPTSSKKPSRSLECCGRQVSA